ncbi:DNA-directed DNA polymerase alpha catalytic subunit pol1 [Exophiala dermatitidis]|uniref:DNA polymerase n=2 Tax=Exophiala dermatitidis TaxID=5970 RepID=H6CA55_EXODN|nr:DNA polymerase alpha subunit A [Exophiala dermatitidis NIH/UT8656]KAJ4507390.1 DNA-directed DNA polymerase alpha catalytic subunit pol1 [Exophiala dermatitidis]EHY60019.1 DNA polymerase alpha subunit A [Exophiala dermatitidis NIH/UT8656]KAJ4509382.1 DNA-directed DNA polymerase alpha catalytic subunit pol1 [Exophiala dermatitidis]KAJ4509569.1 DNA-directed DNA polymerase alpha catalytic subunit pol1 [Exophiala dermatitidis]KAJ4530573.1 DNA-directed DNA polymerase alpha catalytic subunit pol1 
MSHKAAIAQLRAQRLAGKTRLETYQIEDQGAIYDEVDEDGYKKVVRSRLDQDDFVVDDNGEGYADDGREEWQNERQYYSSDDAEDVPLKGNASKRKREETREKDERTNHKILNYFNNAPVTAPKPKIQTTAEDEAFMADLLGEVDANILPTRTYTKKPVKSENRRKVRVLSPPLTQERPRPKYKAPTTDLVDTPPAQDAAPEDDVMHNFDDDDNIMSDPLPSSPVVKAVERKAKLTIKEEENDDDDDVMDVVQVVAHEGVQSASVNMTGSRPPPKIKSAQLPTPNNSSPPLPAVNDVDASSWNNITSKLNIQSSPSSENYIFGKMKPQDAVEEDGSLRFFWLDYTEVNGSLCLFGKVKHKSTGRYLSAFVKVDNVLRKLFFLPRKYRHCNGRETQEEVEMADVYNEVDALMSRMKVTTRKVKPCTRKYAFELPDVPKEAEYLKLLYPYDNAALPMDLQGETFSRVFGTNTALFEQFVLWKNIMGPCWLNIEDADFTAVNNASWCKLECAVTRPANITVLKDSDKVEAPRLTLMSLAFRTQLNVKENKQEILVASARIYENVSLTDTTPPEKLPSRTFTVMRPSGSSYPLGFEAETKKQNGTFMLEKSEQFLLSKFLALFEKVDPDVLMGHQLQEVDYSILLSRLKEKKTPGWHRIGRLKRGEWPKTFGKGGSSFFAERQLLAGRLMCDLANDMGKSLMTKCQQWSLTEMCELYLGPDNPRRDLDNEAALKTWATTRDGLINYVNHCHADTFFIAALVLKLQMLPLTKVLTELAGNSWARTLSGTRAERNEYILLHEFHRNKYICPDKEYGKGRAKHNEENEDGEEGADTKKKDKYKGGLVFEPEKGLYDKFILVMDFNSLYPSIIQEYNICFTTVDRSTTSENENEEKVPEVPDEQTQGILPKLISTLVKRRREVKKLMKDKRATAEDLALWDTKQLALKLTANSMYGCLGYTQSRFYARPLAMLVTFKGREILRSTKELAESNQLQVIYGDTDSVMINTNADNIAQALSVGVDFKRSVNERYKLLEIDIDNIFRRLLLHAKKKYAAINMAEVDGKYVEKLEVKGLDMKRREYCALSKEASQRLLNEILSGEDPEVVLEKIHEYLRELAGKMRENAIPVQKYVIYTKLGKNPKEYPNADSMPQVQVALREIARGKTVRVNDVMSYVVTMGDEQTKSLPAPKRSYTPQDVLKPDSGLVPDVEYYLYKQIFPPIERLCAPIPGTDSVRLAECLGLDVRKYQINTSSGGASQQNNEITPLESQIPDDVRFRDAARLRLLCRACKQTTVYEGLCDSTDLCTPDGIMCSNGECGHKFSNMAIVAQLESQIRVQTSAYYEGWLVCDDPSCGNRTRQMSVYGHRCLGPNGRAEGCLGRMSYEYSEKQLYNQLLYFAGLFDVEKAKNKARSEKEYVEKKDRVIVLAETNKERFEPLKAVVDGYLRKCGRQWVEMDSLFRFALK